MSISASLPQMAVQGNKEVEKVPVAQYRERLQELLSPRLNLRTQQIECDGAPLHEEEFDNLNVSLEEKYALKFKKADLQSTVRAIARKNSFDPVADYLYTLPTERQDVLSDDEWNRIAAICFGLNDGHARVVLQKWLISAVARVMEPGCKVDHCLILFGLQGLQKSTFFDVLAGEFFSDSLGGLDQMKDDILILQGSWINEWSEADQVFAGAQKSEKIKAFITRREDAMRVPYGRNTAKYPRRSILVGTTNRKDWATDPTGNRRFPILAPAEVNIQWVKENRNRIWGRALAELRAGHGWWFSKEEEQEISLVAQSYAPEDPHADDMFQVLCVHANRWFSTREIAAIALQKDPKDMDKRYLRAVARSLTSLCTQGVITERRSHTPVNPSHGGRSTTNCWSYCTQNTQNTQGIPKSQKNEEAQDFLGL